MGKKSSTSSVDQSPWGPTQGSLKYAISELDRLYGRPTAPSTGFSMGGGMGVQGGGPVIQSLFGQRGTSSPMGAPSGAPSPMASPVQEYGLLDPAAAELMSTIQGDRLFQNPYLDEVIRRASADVNSQFSGMGRYGSGAHADALFSRAAAPIRYQDYATERANQLNAVQAAPGFEMAPYQLYGARTAAPYENIRNYLDLLNPIAGRGGTQSSPIYKNPLAGALGGAAAGAAFAPAGATLLGSASTGVVGGSGLAAYGAAVPAMWPYLLGGALLGGLSS